MKAFVSTTDSKYAGITQVCLVIRFWILNMGKRSSNNYKINSLTPYEIDKTVRRISDEKYRTSKVVRKNNNRLSHPVARLMYHKDTVLANPYAFNSSKTYIHPDYAFRPTVNIRGKGDRYARLGLHNLLWRWYNDYKTIPDNMTISHVTDNGYNVNPKDLVLESQEVNSARKACRQQNWYDQYHDNEKRYCKCPHTPVCREREDVPDNDVFSFSSSITFEKLLEIRDQYRNSLQS